MKADERRKEILALLLRMQKPVSGGFLSGQFGVSRQIIVQDISLLKAAGYDILSTHRGYVVRGTPLCERVFKVRHTTQQTEDELTGIVALGGIVADVFVWHRAYGKIRADLNIFSQLQVKQFIDAVRSGRSSELMNITSGYHYHTVRADSEEILDRVSEFLSHGGYIVPEI